MDDTYEYGVDGGPWIAGFLLVAVGLVLVVGLIVFVFIHLSRTHDAPSSDGREARAIPGSTELAMLNDRLARGDIDRLEYLERKSHLEDG